MPYKNIEIKRKRARDYYHEHKEEKKAQNAARQATKKYILKRKEWYNTPKGKESHKASYKKYMSKEENKIKRRIQDKTRRRYGFGKLPKGLEYHHPDYTKPWMFQILTVKAHRALNKKKR